MASRARKRPTNLDGNLIDYGPSVSRGRRGELISAGPGAVVLEDREDPDAPVNRLGNRAVTRGARRWDCLGAMLKDGAITQRQFSAGQRLLDDMSRAVGGSKASFLAVMRAIGHTPDGISERQCRALRQIERVRLAVNLSPDISILWWVVIDNKTVPQFAEHHHIRASAPYRWLTNSLDMLDEFYNPSGRTRDAAVTQHASA